jgi:hemerythrin superfamily protein
MRVTDLITQDHRTVHQLFLELEASADQDTSARRGLLGRLVDELDLHAQAEEEVFYPAVRAVSRRIDDAEDAHEHLRALIAEVQGLDPQAGDFPVRLRQLKQAVLNHAAEEEGGIFIDAARLGLETLERLATGFEDAKKALAARDRRKQKVA